jgi:hypothetical protein
MNNKILIGLVISFVFLLSLACGSATKLMTLSFTQEILHSILDGAEVNAEQGNYTFTVSDLSIESDVLRVEGEVSPETGAVSDGFIDFEVLAEEGLLIFNIHETNLSEIKSEEFVGTEISKDLADLVYQYLAKERNEVEIISVDFVDNVIRIRIRYIE